MCDVWFARMSTGYTNHNHSDNNIAASNATSFPVTRPDGIGLWGSLSASISRSRQSLIVCVYAVIRAPSSIMHEKDFAIPAGWF